MKKHSDPLAGWAVQGRVHVGLDLADRRASFCAVDRPSGELRRGSVKMEREALRELFGEAPASRVVMEAGTHTPWVAGELRALGHEAVVVDARILAGNRRRRKNDRKDAERLMEVALDMEYRALPTIWQRPLEWQEDLALVRMRDALGRSRSLLVSGLRGSVKPFGERLERHSTESLPGLAEEEPTPRTQALAGPLLAGIDELSGQVSAYDRKLVAYLERRPESARLLQVDGVGQVTAAVFMAVIGDPRRFRRSRDVAAYLGLAPHQQQSGEQDPQLGISKAGDGLARRMLVQCAHYILRKGGKDSSLRRWGLKLAGDGTNRARKKKAVVAVARKLAVLLHRLWRTGEAYEPLRGLECAREAA